ncbi:hypothetical protein KDH_31660 [Dictyobacter sp. S3.2.2.5]|uniref:Uncharacterized protein n=1 Tax=Dictyobacter halimunensis TaxID=3026934 RepID=A0ABQ6FRG1_9CHLR|nr:hypothetical protein KDH_31660 [Dictyobacter sp. S3.2.2.5]
MALRPEEVQHLEGLVEDMIKRIEDTNTSNEAAVVYGRIGNACTKTLAIEAAAAAKRTARTNNVTKFRASRENRLNSRKLGQGRAGATDAQSSTQGQRSQGQRQTSN